MALVSILLPRRDSLLSLSSLFLSQLVVDLRSFVWFFAHIHSFQNNLGLGLGLVLLTLHSLRSTSACSFILIRLREEIPRRRIDRSRKKEKKKDSTTTTSRRNIPREHLKRTARTTDQTNPLTTLDDCFDDIFGNWRRTFEITI